VSAPLLWVILPFVIAVGLWFLQKRVGLIVTLASALCLILAGLAFLLPFDESLRLGSLSLRIEPELALIGRKLILDQADRPMLIFMYTLAAFWFTGTLAAGGSRILVPFGLAIIAVLVAAMAVEPELYAALLVEGAVLLSVPMLHPPGQVSSQGVLRYLIFQSLGMPMFILGSWALAGVAANPTDSNLITLTAIFLGFAFSFWLAVFPFYTWVPLLSALSRPYAGGFIFMFFFTTILLLGIGILGANGWLRSSAPLLDILRLSGALMIITAGFWAAFQRDLGRLLGYVVIVQTGFSLTALSLGTHLGNEIFVMMFLPRMVALGLWVLSASVLLQNSRSLHFSNIEQVVDRAPIAAIGVAVSFLSLAGLPLLAEFPIRFVLLQEIAVSHPIAALVVLIGSLGLLFSSFRFLAVITGGNFGPQRVRRLWYGVTRTQFGLIGIGIAALLVVGIVPRFFFPIMIGILPAFGISP
jgi:NADH-quinone oxidoreductase subunit N